MSDTKPRCPRCDSSDCPAAAVEWHNVAATAIGWAPALNADGFSRVLFSPNLCGCPGEPIDWQARARALEAEVERLAGENSRLHADLVTALARIERLETALRDCVAALMRVDIAKPDAVGDAQQAWADAIALADAALKEVEP